MPRATTVMTLGLVVCAAIVVVTLFRDEALESPTTRASPQDATAGTADSIDGSFVPASAAASDDGSDVAPTRESLDAAPAGPRSRTSYADISVSYTSAVDGATLSRGIQIGFTPPATAGVDDGAKPIAVAIMGAATDLTRVFATTGNWTLRASIDGVVVGSRTLDVAPSREPIKTTMSVDAVGPFDGTIAGPDAASMHDAHLVLRVTDSTGEVTESTRSAKVGANGKFQIAALPWRAGCAMSLAPVHQDFARGADVVIVRPDRTIEKRPALRLVDRLAEVVGRVVDERDTPQSEVVVALRMLSDPEVLLREETDEAGEFRARGLRAGAYALTVERRCLASGQIPFEVDAAMPRTDVGTIVAMAPTHALKLLVLDMDRTPLPYTEVVADGVVVGRTDAAGRLTAHLCSMNPVELTVSVKRGGSTASVRAGRYAPSDAEHEIVPGYAGITLRLRDRSEPDAEIHFAEARFVARCGDRQTRGERMIVGSLLVIQQPDMTGSWQIDLDVDDYAPTSVTVDVDSAGTATPIDVWLLRKE